MATDEQKLAFLATSVKVDSVAASGTSYSEAFLEFGTWLWPIAGRFGEQLSRAFAVVTLASAESGILNSLRVVAFWNLALAYSIDCG
jgi:hypothetical protein